MEWKNIYRGFLMGISDLIPGVSGGTIAFLLGIYDRLLTSISGFFSKDWRRHIGFLLPLGIGMAAALLLFSRVIHFLLKHYFAPTQFFFIGLILGILPFMTRQANMKSSFKAHHYLILLTVAALLAATGFMAPADRAVITSLTPVSAILLFLAGWAASTAMLLPGISGSFILLLLGFYSTAIGALSDFNIPVMIVIGLGVVLGFIISSKVIHYLLNRHATLTFSIIIGLIIGSVFVIYPGIPESGTPFVMSGIALIMGLLVSNLFQPTAVKEKVK
ncbi:DUF368 domain-containing protein [Sporosarcina trichiuri]|uniref:DUF368 domain-containing protein n=1 Tax=Sporosarcina trichiuri TaxID=3056445 RepID=UPI0025B51DE1|nr:DUF368 domain-containing protein [Sporosarcina sp. 0.2-SM1T-5]WJY28004.1 DUF368 domain-containing protein [Sporosarcina sp. 0.2-SM1T-5]